MKRDLSTPLANTYGKPTSTINKRKTRRTAYNPNTGQVQKTTGQNRSVSIDSKGNKVVTTTKIRKNKQQGGINVSQKVKTKNIGAKRAVNQYKKAVKKVARKSGENKNVRLSKNNAMKRGLIKPSAFMQAKISDKIK